MGEKFIPKRPHRKSRTGCQTCKYKKVKCDEALPSCTYCRMRKISCHYLQARPKTDAESSLEYSQELVFLPRTPVSLSSEDVDEEIASGNLLRNPSPPLLSAAGGFSMADLRLMHQWTTASFSSILVGSDPVTDDVLQRKLPYLAFRNDFLMHGLLGTAALHMQHLYPNAKEYQKRTDVYRARAFAAFREALCTMAPNTEAYEAALMMSLLLIILCSQKYLTGKDEIIVLHWLPLYSGLCAVLEIDHPGSAGEGTMIYPLIHRKLPDLKIVPFVPTILLSMIRSIKPTDPDYKGLKTYCFMLDRLATLYATLRQDGLGNHLYNETITYPSHTTEDFILFAKQKRPRTLIILSYFLSFVKVISGLWWVEGIADKDIPIISRTVGPKWVRFMEVPLQVVEMTDRQEIAKLLLK